MVILQFYHAYTNITQLQSKVKKEVRLQPLVSTSKTPTLPLTHNPKMLCPHCTSIFSGTRQFSDEEVDARFTFEEYPHHPSLKSLLQSAKDGCHICAWIANDFTFDADRGGWLLRGKPLATEDFGFKYAVQRDSWGENVKPEGAKEVFKICFWSVEMHVVYFYRIGGVDGSGRSKLFYRLCYFVWIIVGELIFCGKRWYHRSLRSSLRMEVLARILRGVLRKDGWRIVCLIMITATNRIRTSSQHGLSTLGTNLMTVFICAKLKILHPTIHLVRLHPI